MSETKLDEMLRLQQPPAGYMCDAASIAQRVRQEGSKNRAKRNHPRGLVLSDPLLHSHRGLRTERVRKLSAYD
jgi:hypothetical protein